MKTTKLLLAAAILATFTYSVSAADIVMSPKAQEQQPRTASGTNTDPNLLTNRNLAASPRTLDLQPKVAAGKNIDRDLIAESRLVPGTPKGHDFNAAAFQVAPVK